MSLRHQSTAIRTLDGITALNSIGVFIELVAAVLLILILAFVRDPSVVVSTDGLG